MIPLFIMNPPKISIFNPRSPSYKFYKNLFDDLTLNQMLHSGGVCKLMKDMTNLEYLSYVKYVAENVTDNRKTQ
jgi:hypothetical protein